MIIVCFQVLNTLQNYKKYRFESIKTSFGKSYNTKEVAMKHILFLASVLLILSACTSTQYPVSSNDDVYYSPNSQPPPVQKQTVVVKTTTTETYAQPQQGEPAPTEVYTNTDTVYNSEIPSNVYNQDDYYDYAYSARIKRFYDPYAYNNGYYNDYYTNSYYYDPYYSNWGASIYMGYNFWGFGLSYVFGYNPWYSYPYYAWGYPYYGYGYGYGYPYYGYDYPYYGYGGGGYYGGCCYYNSYDQNSAYYGHRGSSASTGGYSNVDRTEGKTFGERYEARLGTNNLNGTQANTRGNAAVVPASRGSVSTSRGDVSTDNTKSSLTRGEAVPQGTRNAASSSATPDTRSQEAVTTRPGVTTQRPAAGTVQPQRQYKYTSPTRTNQVNGSTSRGNVNTGRNTQTYTSPDYNRPRSGEEYTSPKYRNAQPSGNEQNNNRVAQPTNGNTQSRSGSPQYSQPNNDRPTQSRSNANYQTPRNNTNSQPARTSPSYSPSRSSSPAPSRSNDSYSPSRNSSPSYSPSSSPSRSSPSPSSSPSSSPSRSSGSSGGNPSGGSGHRK